MPSNNFLLFDENKQNMLEDAAYAASQQRLGGVQTGIASSQLNNKFAYQVSLVAYAIAQLMNANGLDATDTLQVTTFVSNLSNSLVQKVADLATKTQMAAGTVTDKYVTPALVKYALQNSGLITAAGIASGAVNIDKLESTLKSKIEALDATLVPGAVGLANCFFISNGVLFGQFKPVNANLANYLTQIDQFFSFATLPNQYFTGNPFGLATRSVPKSSGYSSGQRESISVTPLTFRSTGKRGTATWTGITEIMSLVLYFNGTNTLFAVPCATGTTDLRIVDYVGSNVTVDVYANYTANIAMPLALMKQLY